MRKAVLFGRVGDVHEAISSLARLRARPCEATATRRLDDTLLRLLRIHFFVQICVIIFSDTPLGVTAVQHLVVYSVRSVRNHHP